MNVDKRAEQLVAENCSFSYTYPITILDGKLVHDEWTAALFRAGYQIVAVAAEQKAQP